MGAGVALALVVALSGVSSPSASAADCSGSTTPGAGWFDTQLDCDQPSSTKPGDHNTQSGKPFYTAYRWTPTCGDPTSGASGAKPCPTNTDWCAPGEKLYWLQGLHEGQWYDLGWRCASTEAALDAAPLITPGMVLREFERVPLPALRSITQPGGRTLVNFATIFRVEAEPVNRVLTLAGQRVELAITPSSFRWVYGDGTAATTRTPGAAYPRKDVAHRYQHAHVTVRHHVEITWSARWRLRDEAWQEVPGTVTTVGPATALRIAEATPVLSGEGH